MTIICVDAGTYHAEIALELLPELPIRDIRKLLRIMQSDPWENREAIQIITDWLPAAVSDAKNTWGYSVAIYKDGWRIVPKGYHSAGATEQRRKNNQLTNAVKNAKAAYDRLVKIQSVYNEIKEK